MEKPRQIRGFQEWRRLLALLIPGRRHWPMLCGREQFGLRPVAQLLDIREQVSELLRSKRGGKPEL